MPWGNCFKHLRQFMCEARHDRNEEECMEVTGHKSRSMFKRYADLFSEEEKRESQRKAQQRCREYREAQATNLLMMPTGTKQ
jgi:hypothetical protein